MAASRPGNPERGWNDPPMFLYKTENQAQPSPKKTNLTQRVGMPQNYPSLANKSTGSPGKPSPFLPTSPAHKGPPPSGPPPTGPPPGSIPPASRLSGPPPTAATPTNASPSKEDNKDLPVDVCETTLAKLKEVLQSFQEKLQKRISDDISKKLTILEDSWSKDKLCKPVKQRMAKLAEALTRRRFDEANELHLSLMVDYVAEVSQWMVGVKRLIFEAKKHLPPQETKDNSDNTDSNDNKKAEKETDSPKSDTQATEEASVSKSEACEQNSESGDKESGQAAEETSKQQSEECIGDSNGTPE